MASSNLQDKTEIAKVFNRFDTNNDGKISAGELVGVMKCLGSATSDAEVAVMMADIDSDRDGFISLHEFSMFLLKGGLDEKQDGDKDGADGVLKEAFDMYDQNKDGLISVAELHRVLSKLGESCTVEDCGKMIGTFDSDGDGHVSFEEFKKMMEKNNAK